MKTNRALLNKIIRNVPNLSIEFKISLIKSTLIHCLFCVSFVLIQLLATIGKDNNTLYLPANGIIMMSQKPEKKEHMILSLMDKD